MSTVRKPIAILTGDTHFSHEAPKCRAEKGVYWYDVMRRYINQIRKHARLGSCDELPIFHSGDLLDTWNQPPELVNFLLDELPQMWAIPGQHDLPNHRFDDLYRSAWWTLEQARKIKLLKPYGHDFDNFIAFGFAWGVPFPEEMPGMDEQKIWLAVTHRYVSHPMSASVLRTKENHISTIRSELHNWMFGAIVAGDNHAPYCDPVKGGTFPKVFINGTFIRHKKDEIDYKPHVGILYSDSTIESVLLDTSQDRFLEVDDNVESAGLDAEGLLQELNQLADATMKFKAACRKLLNRYPVDDMVSIFVNSILNGVTKK